MIKTNGLVFIRTSWWCIFAFFQVGFTAQSCDKDIQSFSKTGIITSSKSEVEVGDSVTVTCSSQCAWEWHVFSINGEHVIGSHSSSRYSINGISDEILNCPDCEEPSHQDCSDSKQGPVKSTLNMTITTSGEYYIQCITQLFSVPTVSNGGNWPNEIIFVYSENLKIQVINKPDSVDPQQMSNVTKVYSQIGPVTSFTGSSTLLTTAMGSASCFDVSAPLMTTVTETVTRTVTTSTDCSILHDSTGSSVSSTTTTGTTTGTTSAVVTTPVVMGRTTPVVDLAGASQQEGVFADQAPYLVVILFLTTLIVFMFFIIMILLYFYKKRLKMMYGESVQ